MFKNILLIILILLNGILITRFQYASIDMLSLHIIAASFAAIISILYIITRVSKVTLYLSFVTLCITTYHIYQIIMTIYHNVYVK
ncbi:hypothetical protein [Macrococcus armenti]|uniref:Uncharacterized protein n=1 Tax=Macrococcus armenti TaxID=2875764 RepID=A0ABY3ZXM3_9STAP|nr:hypothetical protein [Macrococcus armenti]UOB20699.1 hypothetical protein MRZ06_01040 [Macrococcus armenti]